MQAKRAKILVKCGLKWCTLFLIVSLLGCASINAPSGEIENDTGSREPIISRTFKNLQATLKETFSALSTPKSGGSDIRKQSSQPIVHTVLQHGETLGLIAQWYTGDARHAKRLAELNPHLKSTALVPGDAVKVPAELAKQSAPMSAKFRAEHLAAYHRHTVCWSGETLSLIAKWYTGSYSTWRKLAAHNPELNPDRIVIGQNIYIPTAMLKTRQPLPRKVAAKYLPDYFAYKVSKSKNRLSDIARWYTGDPKNSEALVALNPGLNPANMKIGYEIYIPSELLKTRQPMPQPVAPISENTGAEEDPQGQKPPTTTEEQELQLFGPKQFPKS